MSEETQPVQGSEDLILNKKILLTQAGLQALAVICASALTTVGVVSLFVDQHGDVVTALPGEIELDGLEEGDAVRRLLDAGYTEESVEVYLSGRDARAAHRASLGRFAPAPEAG